MSFRRRINTSPWKGRPLWRRRGRKKGEWLIASEETATTLDCSSPWGVAISTVTSRLDTAAASAYVPIVPLLLTSALEDTILGQPIWPEHTVERIIGSVFVSTGVDQNASNPTSPWLYHWGVKLVETDENGALLIGDVHVTSEPEADDRWVAMGHLFVPGGINTSPGAGEPIPVMGAHNTQGARASIEVNIRNKVKVPQDKALVWFHGAGGLGWTSSVAWSGNGVVAEVLPWLRTYVVRSARQ